jgi:hypothetical protein
VGNNGIQVGGYASFDYLNQATNRTFGGASFLGNTINSMTNAGITVGVEATPQIFIYTNFGPSWIDRNQKLNFLGRTTAVDSSAPGVTVGGGVDFLPPGWSVPITVEIDHTFVQQKTVINGLAGLWLWQRQRCHHGQGRHPCPFAFGERCRATS